MKNAPDLELSLLARQWGATAVPFGELTSEAWLENPAHQRALALLQQTATLRSVMLLSDPNGVGKVPCDSNFYRYHTQGTRWQKKVES